MINLFKNNVSKRKIGGRNELGATDVGTWTLVVELELKYYISETLLSITL